MSDEPEKEASGVGHQAAGKGDGKLPSALFLLTAES
jgi:hypothetical protein